MVGQLTSRILLVDDDSMFRRVITGNLLAAGYVVRGALDGLDALRKLRAGIPDLLITDLNMPRMSGVELITIVRHRFPQMPIIAIGADTVHDPMPEDLGADAFHDKSRLGLADLMQTVCRLTQGSSRRPHAAISEGNPVRAQWDGDGHFLIRCEECLRSFKVSRALCTGYRNHWVTCIHCGSTIQFLVEAPGAEQ